ncbi:adhesion G protein-coupled receptor L2-like [Gadus chalcogrammus]|uniref:adhesion G protein-coupled receptor L2-like n=1 Tax=Gadus chalcogrammus TaxID=1042646 RepID=UPI0024C47A48|nr:adhesion G protein-coupled receptor L2-like [Gadus chalcogrammus]
MIISELVTVVGVGGGGGGGGSSSEDDAMGVEPAASLVQQRVLEAPLIPQRTHSLLYVPKKLVRTDGGVETFGGPHADPAAADNPAPHPYDDGGGGGGSPLQSPSRDHDSLYASAPRLKDEDSPCPESCSSPDAPPSAEEDLSPSKGSENEDVYYKSMPNLGAGQQQLQAYYQISRVGSDGYIIPITTPTKEGCVPEGDVREGQMQLVTSL